jgi:hypothetical protein
MLNNLTARLEAAPEGSRELDLKIRHAVEPYNFSNPHYTTSLDAKLPWENIVAVNYEHVSGNWMAAHLGEKTVTWGIGRTEPLARRIAALRARTAGSTVIEGGAAG